jgi:type IV secretory pathway TrbL component
MPDPGILDLFLKAFMSVFSLAWTGLTPGALWLASQLTALCLLPYLALMVLGIQHALMSAARPLIKIAFVVWVLGNLQFLNSMLADWVVAIGLFVGRAPAWLVGVEPVTVEKFMSPGTVLFEGLNMMLPVIKYVDNMSMWQIPAILAYDFFCVIPLWFCFGAVSLSILVAVIEFQIVSLWSLFPIAFSLFGGTAFVAANAVSGIIASATRLGVLALVTGLILPLTFYLAIPLTGEEPDWWSILSAGLGAVFLGLMAIFAPRYASTVYGGQPAWTGAALVGLVANAASGGVKGAQRWLRG